MGDFETGALIILGLGIFGGTIGAKIFQLIRVPQVVGYICVGLLIGDVGFGIVNPEAVTHFYLVNLFALGVIGFLVGGELHADVFRGRGIKLFTILIGEGVGAFILVGVGVGILTYWVSGNVSGAVAAGLVFGAIASATDPGSTLSVLWEYRSRGILTTTLVTLVALDDALAMTLYGLGTAIARIVSGGDASVSHEIISTSVILLGSIAMGVGAAVGLRFIIDWLKRGEQIFVCAVGVLLLVIGIAATFDMDVILTSMSLGCALVNVAPRRSKELFSTVRSFSGPIYAIFFVLVGARLEISVMPWWLWTLVGIYVVARGVGKALGVYLGSILTNAEPVIRKFGGLGLFAQGGVAVGLAIMAGQHLSNVEIGDGYNLGDLIIFGVTATTLIVQIIGPPLIHLAAKLAGESGRDVTEEDVIESLTVLDVMTKGIEPIRQETPLTKVFRTFADNDHLMYPVVSKEGKLRGVICLDDLKDVIASQDTWQWVLAADVMAPARDTVPPEMSLRDAIDYMETHGIEEVPVVGNGNGVEHALGILNQRGIRIRINEEIVRRRQPLLTPATA